jgi:hypothetical protein
VTYEIDHSATKLLLGSGIFIWGSEERVSNRYGAFTLCPSNFDENVEVPVSFDAEGAAPLIGTRVKITCLIIESRPSGHAGDKALGLIPHQPDVGALIEVGVGIFDLEPLSFANSVPAIVLRPDVDRDELWIDPRRLYQLHDQTVRVFVEPTDEPCTPQADLIAQSGSWSNGDNTIQTKRIKLVHGMKAKPKIRPLGDGMFEINTQFAESEAIHLFDPNSE